VASKKIIREKEEEIYLLKKRCYELELLENKLIVEKKRNIECFKIKEVSTLHTFFQFYGQK
jgi:hypothetical protein